MKVTRNQARAFIRNQMKFDTIGAVKKKAWHYGRCEIEELLDFIYGEKCLYCEETEIHHEMCPRAYPNCTIRVWEGLGNPSTM